MNGGLAMAEKLLRLALDPAESEPEAINAAGALVRKLRALGVNYDQMRRGLAGVEQRIVTKVVYAPIKGSECNLTFGKYKGRRLCDVFRSDPGYVEWMVDKCECVPETIKNAAEDLLDNS